MSLCAGEVKVQQASFPELIFNETAADCGETSSATRTACLKMQVYKFINISPLLLMEVLLIDVSYETDILTKHPFVWQASFLSGSSFLIVSCKFFTQLLPIHISGAFC